MLSDTYLLVFFLPASFLCFEVGAFSFSIIIVVVITGVFFTLATLTAIATISFLKLLLLPYTDLPHTPPPDVQSIAS